MLETTKRNQKLDRDSKIVISFMFEMFVRKMNDLNMNFALQHHLGNDK